MTPEAMQRTLRTLLTTFLAALPARFSAEPSLPQPDLSGLEQAVQTQIIDYQSLVLTTFERSESTPSQRATVVGRLGQVYHAYELNDAAVACYTKAEELAPNTMLWPYYLASVAQSVGKLETALRFYERALVLRRDHLPSLVHLGEVHLQAGDVEAARVAFRRAHALPQDSAAVRAGLGQVALVEHAYTEAIEHFESALALVPDANRLHYPLAMAYRAASEHDQARVHLSQAGFVGVRVADPPLDELDALRRGERAHSLRGRLAYRAARFEEAVTAFQAAVEAAPDSAGARVNLGSALAGMGRDDLAMAELREALRLEPANPNALYNLGQLLVKGAYVDEAAALFSRLVELRPEDIAGREALARVLERSGDREQARTHYHAILGDDPSHEAAYLGLARIMITNGELRAALSLLEDAHQRAPERGLTARALSHLLASARDPELRDGERALALAVRVFEAQRAVEHAETVALAMAQLGRCADAAEWQQGALEAASQRGAAELARRLQTVLSVYEQGPPCAPQEE